MIEHLANPLGRWRNGAASPGRMGTCCSVAPHKSGTFDHRRPVTTLEHIQEDFRLATGEDDPTHLDETLRLHDRERDVPLSDEDFVRSRRENLHHRVLHHHVFTTPVLLSLLDAARLQVLAVEVRYPHDIYVLGQWAEQPDNERFLADRPGYARRSPFAADRGRASRWRTPGAPGP